MNSFSRRTSWVIAFLAVTCLGFNLFGQTAQFRPPVARADGQIELRLEGPAGKAHRIEVSTDLRQWSELLVLENTNTLKVFTVSVDRNATARYYRAVEQGPRAGFQIVSIEPSAALPGTEIVINGVFTQPASDTDHVARFGRATAHPVNATSSQWKVVVPPGAESGPIQLLTATTNTESEVAFTVLGLAPVTLTPPTGVAAGEYTIVNDYGGVTNINGVANLMVRGDLPSLNLAANRQTNRFLYAFSLAGGQPVTLGIQSTAEAFVFMTPIFATMDSLLASNTLQVIRQNAKVRELGLLLDPLYSQPGDPFTNAAVQAKYAEAVRDVAGQPALMALSPARNRPEKADLGPDAPSGDYNMDLEFTMLVNTDKKNKSLGPFARRLVDWVGPRFPKINPVDWYVVTREIDTEAAFPQGRIDFDKAWRDKKQRLVDFPLKPGYTNAGSVSANLITEKFNLIKLAVKTIAEAVQNAILPNDDTIQFPPQDGIYIVRAIGPGIFDTPENDFAIDHFREERTRAIAGNIAAVVFDLVSLLIDLEKIEFHGAKTEIMAKITLEIYKAVPKLKAPSDLGDLTLDLVKFTMQEIADKVVGAGVKFIFTEGIKQAAEDTTALGALLSGLDKAGGAGQIFQRELGILTTSAMETALVVIGDPFKIEPITIQPELGPPGTELELTLESTALARMFDPFLATDKVNFEGPDHFDGEVVAVTGTPNRQVLRVKIPETLAVSADGAYKVFVNLNGRRGSVAFRLVSAPFITSITPQEGFAAVDDFLGVPFTGSQLQVKGALFTSSDRLFLDPNMEVTSKSGGAGNLRIRIPKGAETSLLRVVYRGRTGESVEVKGPLVVVWREPVIESVTPNHGSVGTPIVLKLRRAGTDPNLIRVQFTGTQPGNVAVSPDGTVRTVVLNGAKTGPLTVITPAGSASVNFVVDPAIPGLDQVGSEIRVGGGSPITFDRALVYAQGNDFPPADSTDFVTKLSLSNEAPHVVLGPQYRNSISLSGGAAGDYVIAGTDNFNGGSLGGNITVSATGARFSGINFSGQLTVTGTSNLFSNCTISGTARVTGTGNLISGVVTGQLILEGDNNATGILTSFRNTPGHALIIRGNHNTITSGNFDTNGADAIRIEGGQHNFVEVNRSRGNLGNGVTLTAGAAYNEVKFSSGIKRSNTVIEGGNRGHGVALLGDAHDNHIYVLDNGASGNGLDGAFLDGPGVVRNRLGGGDAFFAYCNGRNGITITNAASNNEVGTVNLDGQSTVVEASFNKGSGLVLGGVVFTGAALYANSNGFYGVLVSGVKDPPSGTVLLVGTGFSSSFGSLPGNPAAGLRLEKGTTGVRANFGLNLRRNQVGVELDGEGTAANVLEGMITDTVTDGVIVRSAHRNDFTLRVDRSGGNGATLYGATKNLIRINGIQDNQGDGVRFVGGAENQVIPASDGTLARNRNGLVFEQGTHGNFGSDFTLLANRENGLLIDGAGTTKNSFADVRIVNSALAGVRIQNRATGVSLGVAVENPNFPVRGSSLQNNTNAAVHITGEGTRDITVAGCFISAPAAGLKATGILVENNASAVTLEHNTLFKTVNGILIRDGAHEVSVTKSIFESNTESGIKVLNGANVIIGAPGTPFSNSIYSNLAGIKLSGSAVTNCQIQNNSIYRNTAGVVLEARANGNLVGPANLLQENVDGVSVDFAGNNVIQGNTIQRNISTGVRLAGGAAGNLLTGNEITGNGTGVLVTGAATLRNSILNNSITANDQGHGIRLADGGNRQIAAPDFEEIQGNAITGTSSAPDGSRVQIFQDPGPEGKTLFTAAQVVKGRFRAAINVEPWTIGLLFNVNATVTDPDGNTSEFKSKFPPDGDLKKVVFTSTRDGNSEIYLIDPPSATPVNLTRHPANDHSPALASSAGGGDCNEILFVSDRAGNRDIFSLRATPGSAARQLTTHVADDYDPAWLEPCKDFVFVSERDGNAEIYKMNLDGTGLTRLTDNAAIDRRPRPNSERTKILFESNRGGRFGLWIMNRDGSDQRPLLISTSVDTQPVMSPDGTEIAFVSERDGNAEIYVMRADGTGVTRLTTNGAPDRDPAWLPDGSAIAFSSGIPGAAELYLVPRAGGIPQPMTLSSGDNTQPAFP